MRNCLQFLIFQIFIKVKIKLEMKVLLNYEDAPNFFQKF